MSRLHGAKSWVVALALAVAPGVGAPSVALADPQPAVLPGQPGGDPAPDTKDATSLLQRGRFEDAIAASKRALARDERYVPAMLVMAKSYYYLKKYELSSSIIDLAKQLDPNNAEAYHLLGWIALARNDITTATADFKKATELKDDYGNAWNNLAAQYLLAKNYDAALDASKKATDLLPKFEKAWLNLGSAHRGKGENDEAEKAYRKALELNPNYADAYFNLGILYLDAKQMGQLDLITKLNTAIQHLAKYKNLAGTRLANNDPADGYIDGARKDIDREQKRLDRLAKQKARDAAKKPPAAAAGDGANGAPVGGGAAAPPPASGNP